MFTSNLIQMFLAMEDERRWVSEIDWQLPLPGDMAAISGDTAASNRTQYRVQPEPQPAHRVIVLLYPGWQRETEGDMVPQCLANDTPLRLTPQPSDLPRLSYALNSINGAGATSARMALASCS